MGNPRVTPRITAPQVWVSAGSMGNMEGMAMCDGFVDYLYPSALASSISHKTSIHPNSPEVIRSATNRRSSVNSIVLRCCEQCRPIISLVHPLKLDPKVGASESFDRQDRS